MLVVFRSERSMDVLHVCTEMCHVDQDNAVPTWDREAVMVFEIADDPCIGSVKK